MNTCFQIAYEEGWKDGRLARQYCRQNYATGPEWIYWYRGWRAGKAAALDNIVVKKGISREWAEDFYRRQSA